jgi:hypothetical protein
MIAAVAEDAAAAVDGVERVADVVVVVPVAAEDAADADRLH